MRRTCLRVLLPRQALCAWLPGHQGKSMHELLDVEKEEEERAQELESLYFLEQRRGKEEKGEPKRICADSKRRYHGLSITTRVAAVTAAKTEGSLLS